MTLSPWVPLAYGSFWFEAAMVCLRAVSDGIFCVWCRHTNFNSYIQFSKCQYNSPTITQLRLSETLTPLKGTLGFHGIQFEEQCRKWTLISLNTRCSITTIALSLGNARDQYYYFVYLFVNWSYVTTFSLVKFLKDYGHISISILFIFKTGTVVAQWLRCRVTNRKVSGSIPAGISGFFIDIKSLRSHYGPGVNSVSNRNE